MRCPNARCSHNVVASVPTDDAAPTLLTREAARRKARRLVFARHWWALILTLVLVCGAFAFGGFLFLWQFLTPASSGGSSSLAWLVLVAITAVGALIPVTIYLSFILVCAERWLARLPRAELAFVATPDLYRE